MAKIIIKEKPAEMSYEVIHDLLWRANQQNREKGFHLKTAELNGQQIEERIGKDGKCFIAFLGEKPVGTLSVRFVQRDNRWYASGIIADYILAGVLPEYQGLHINSMLAEKVFDYVKEKGVEVVELDTATENKHAISIYEHQGFKKVSYTVMQDADHYSVIMVKWLTKCPYPDFYRFFVYHFRRIKVRLLYKKGRSKRF